MTYKEKLRDPRWQRKKNEILIRDNYTCQAFDCGSTTKNLQVHHIEYLSIDPWEYPNDMLITLCEDCHNKESGREELEKHFATTLKMKGFLMCDLLAFSSKIDTDILFTKSLLTILRRQQNG